MAPPPHGLQREVPDKVLAWVTTAPRDSHRDEKRFREEALAKLQREHQRLQDRIDAMYMDKLDVRIDAGFFDRKAAEEGIKLLDLAGRNWRGVVDTFRTSGVGGAFSAGCWN